MTSRSRLAEGQESNNESRHASRSPEKSDTEERSSPADGTREQKATGLAEGLKNGALNNAIGGGRSEPLQGLANLAEGKAIILRKTDQIFKKLGKAV